MAQSWVEKCSIVTRVSAPIGTYHPSSSWLLSPVWIPMRYFLPEIVHGLNDHLQIVIRPHFYVIFHSLQNYFLFYPRKNPPVQKQKVIPQGHPAGQWWSWRHSPQLPTALSPVTHSAVFLLCPWCGPKAFCEFGKREKGSASIGGQYWTPLSSSCPVKVPQGSGRCLRNMTLVWILVSKPNSMATAPWGTFPATCFCVKPHNFQYF